jgi:hypothetical protein
MFSGKFHTFGLWLLVSRIQRSVKIWAFIIGVTFLTVLIPRVSLGSTKHVLPVNGACDHKRPGQVRQSKSSTEMLRKAKTRSKAQRPPIPQPDQDDTRVTSSGQGTAQSGVAQPERSSGPVYSKVPELTPAQVKALKKNTEAQETVPVPQGRVWTEIPKPTDPPAEPVLGESGLRPHLGLPSAPPPGARAPSSTARSRKPRKARKHVRMPRRK